MWVHTDPYDKLERPMMNAFIIRLEDTRLFDRRFRFILLSDLSVLDQIRFDAVTIIHTSRKRAIIIR